MKKAYMLMIKENKCFGHGDYRPVYTPKTNGYEVMPSPIYSTKEKAEEAVKNESYGYHIIELEIID